MKKALAVILTFLVVMSAASAFAAEITVLVNGEAIEFDRDAKMQGEVVMLPYRHIAEKLGAKVSWHQETKTVFTEYDGSIITAQIDNELMFVNDKTYTLENAPMLVIDRTLVPVSVFENGMGVKIVWDSASSTVTIEK